MREEEAQLPAPSHHLIVDKKTYTNILYVAWNNVSTRMLSMKDLNQIQYDNDVFVTWRLNICSKPIVSISDFTLFINFRPIAGFSVGKVLRR